MADKKLPPQEEEVDLGNLFKVIGKGIKSFFEAIWFFLKQVFHYFILLLIFFKKNSIKLGATLILGFIVGFIFHKTEPKTFVSDMIIETNYGSGKLLYKQVEYLNDLVKKKDSGTLSQALNIDKHQAAQITGIRVEPFQPEKYLYILYDEYIQNTDTIYTRNFEFEDFKKRMLDDDLRFHEIEVSAKSKAVFPLLSGSFIKLLNNDYFKNINNIKVTEIKNKLAVLNKNLAAIDTLRKTYKEIALKEAENKTATSVIEIAKSDQIKQDNDISLFHISTSILDDISKTNSELIRKNNVVNIISDFNEIGVPDKNIWHKKYVQFALLFFGLMLGWLLLKQLNRFLNEYK